MNDAAESSAERVAEILAAYQEQLVERASPTVDTSGLNAEELDQFRRLKDCLIQLEQLRTLEGTIEAVGETWQQLVVGSQTSDGRDVGHVRIGRFEILRELGRGGLGVVFLAHDELLNRLVALKVPRPEVLITSDVRERFDREAQATARLTHPHLVPVHEVGQVGPIIYIVSAYCPGPNLRQWLDERGGSVSPRQAAQLVAVLAAAVHYAHCQGVLHRDIKPSNVLLEPVAGDTDLAAEGVHGNELPFVPKLVDFGLARLTDAMGGHTRSGVAMGTFGYMAPEQAEGRLRDVGPATDVHALGAVLYECLTGRAPYSGESEADCLRRIVSDEPPRPSNIDRQIPRDLEAICLKCLEKLPARRYAAAGDLAADLHRFLAGESTKARPLGPIDRAWHWTRRRPAAAALLAVSLFAGLTIVAGSVFYSVRIDRALAVSEQRRIEADEMRGEAEANARLARDQEARVRQHVYVAGMRVAQQLRHDGDLASLAPLLDRYIAPAENADAVTRIPRPTGDAIANTGSTVTDRAGVMPFEWRYLDRMRNVIRLSFQAHAGDIDLLTFSAQGDVLATASVKEGQVRLWEIPSGRPLGNFAVRTKPARRAQEEIGALSPNGDRVATLVDPQTIVVWDVHSHAELARLTHKRLIHSVAFLSDPTQVVGAGDEETLVWDCQTGQVVHTYPAARLVTVSPDGRQLGLVDAPVAANQVYVWDMPSGVGERRFAWPGSVRQISYSPDATKLASLVDYPLWSQINVVDPHSGLVVRGYVERGERYTRIGFSGDSRAAVAVAGNGSLRFWDSQSGQSPGTLRGPAKRLTNFAFSPDNRWLATAESGGGVLVWDGPLLSSCDELVPTHDVVGPIVFSPDGKTLAASTSDRHVLLMDRTPTRVDARLGAHVDRIRDLCFSPDSAKLLTTDGQSVCCWNRGDGKRIWSLNVRARYLAWSAEPNVIAVGGYDNSVRLHDPDNGSEVEYIESLGPNELTGLCVVPKSNLLVATSADARIYFWSLTTRKLVKTVELNAAVLELVLSADGQALAAGLKTGDIRVWSLKDAPLLGDPLLGIAWQGGCPSSFTLSPDGKVLGTGGPLGVFQALDISTSEHLYTLSGRRVGGAAVAYSPDGDTLATVSRTGCLTLWNLTDWHARTLDGSPLMAARSLAFSPDGSTLAVGTDDAITPDQPPTDNLPVFPNVRKFASRRSTLALSINRSVSFDERPWDVSSCGFRLWDVATTQERPPQATCSTLTAIPLVVWSCRGTIAAGSDDGTVWIWDSNAQELITRFAVGRRSDELISWQFQPDRVTVPQSMLKQLDGIVALAFSSQGDKLAVATKLGTIQLVDANDWDKRRTLCADATDVACLAFSPSGSTLVANRRGQLLGWSLENDDEMCDANAIGQKDASQVCSAAFAHDGARLAIGRIDGSAELWDAQLLSPQRAKVDDGRHQSKLKGHLDRVASMSFSPDDRTLATGSWDTTVRLWHVASAQEVAVLNAHHGKVEAVAFSPDGGLLATGGQRDGDHGEVFLWRASP